MKFSFNNKNYYISKPNLVPAFFFLLGLSILISLSIWQFNRLEWKTNLINERINRFESEFKIISQINTPSDHEFQRIKILGKLLNEFEFFMPALSKNGNNGFHILTLLKEESGKVIIFDTGWVPLNKKEKRMRNENLLFGKKKIEAIIRLPGRKGRFQPDNDEKKNFWFFVEPSKIQRITGFNVEQNFYLEAIQNGPNGFPLGNQTRIYLRNNHFQYAITWLMIAFGLVGVFFFANIREKK